MSRAIVSRIGLLGLLMIFICTGCATRQASPAELRAGGSGIAAAAHQPHFHFADISDESTILWQDDKPVLVYNHGPISRRASTTAPTTSPTQPHSNYIHPLYGVDGEVLTDDFPADHVHHRGLYWAWPHVKVGDQQVDLWSLRGIRQDFGRWIVRETRGDVAVLSMENGWFVADKQIMRERATVEVHAATADTRAIDVTLAWTPTDRPVTLSGAEGKSYGGLALRFGSRKQTITTTPDGVAKEDLVLAKLPWADLSGDLKGADQLSGVAIFVAPDHPDYPPTWMVRHYGMLAIGWPGVTPRTIAVGETITCRYRVWIHRGAPSAGEIQKAYDAYRAERAGGGS